MVWMSTTFLALQRVDRLVPARLQLGRPGEEAVAIRGHAEKGGAEAAEAGDDLVEDRQGSDFLPAGRGEHVRA
jgi:hypothetical protein